MAHRFLLEILTEEIPAWMLSSRLQSLREQFVELVRGAFGIEPGADDVIVDATSRRLFVHLDSLPARQVDRVEEVKGPPRKIAYEADGSPSKALQGFLRKNGATESDLLGEDGDYVRLRRTVEGKTTQEILGEAIPGMIEGIRWPKTMRIGMGERSWIRPIHSVVSLFDSTPLAIEILGVSSSNETRGHRTLGNQPVAISGYEDYVSKLGALHVVVQADERVSIMRRKAHELAAEVGGVPAEDESIWDQWRYLTEAPGVVRAEFDRDYLTLPNEVLTTVMRVHQKQLPILSGGVLSNSFLAVIDQTGDPDGHAASGNAFVTNARFADARFFYQTDQRKRLGARSDGLSHLQFHEKLGNYAQKGERIERLAAAIASETGSDAGEAAQAAGIAKADLVTEMVKEFTELQGKIGGIYAREEGYPEPVWQAVYDHYLPVNAEDPLPRGAAGAIVSIADRIDTLTGFFVAGIRPSGSRDPFALRRAAQGLVQILLNRGGWHVEIGVTRLIDLALAAYGRNTPEEGKVKDDLLEFIAERLRTILENSPFGFAYDEVSAVMASGWADSLTDVLDRIAALRAIRNQPHFLSLLDSVKRIANITADGEGSTVRPALLQEPAEKRLGSLAALVGEQLEELIAAKRYGEALESFAGLADDLETFFDEVMVMVDDEAVRENRKALLRTIGNLVRPIAEVTRVVVDRSDYTAER